MSDVLKVKDYKNYFRAEWPTDLDLSHSYELAYQTGRDLDALLQNLDPKVRENCAFPNKSLNGVIAYDVDPSKKLYIAKNPGDLVKYNSWRNVEQDLSKITLGGFRIGFESCDIIYRSADYLTAITGKTQTKGEFILTSHLNLKDEVQKLAINTNSNCDITELTKLDQMVLIPKP